MAAGAGIQSPAIWTSGEADGFRVIARGDKRAAAAGIATRIGNQSFRATGITVFQKLGGPFVRLRSWRRLAVGDRSPEAFVADSPLEGDGFEPSVPRKETTLTQLRRFEHFLGSKCLRLLRRTPEGRHYSGVGGAGAMAVILGGGWAGSFSFSFRRSRFSHRGAGAGGTIT